MKFEEALEFFMFDDDYSLEDLIKIYLDNIFIMNEYDFTDLKNQMNKLNAAKDCLLEHLLEKKMIENNLDDVCSYREQKIMELEFFFAHVENGGLKLTSSDIELIEALKLFFVEETLDKDIKTIDCLFNGVKDTIFRFYNKIALNYGSENGVYIDEEYIRKIINDKCSLLDFWRSLEVFRKAKTDIIKRLFEEERKYYGYIGYAPRKIKLIKEKYKEDIISEYLKNGYVDLEKRINEMHEEIKNELDEYSKIVPQHEELERILKELCCRSLLNEYQSFRRTINFNHNSTVSFVQDGVRDLMNKVEEYKRKKEVFDINKSRIFKIRESLIKRCPKKYTNNKLKILQRKKLGILLDLFDKGCINFCDFEYFNLFNEITFIDKEIDNKIIELIINKLYPYYDSNVTKSCIYLDKNEKFENGWISYYYLENNEVYRYDRWKSTYEKVNIDSCDVLKNFTSLDEIFNEAEPVGKWVYDYVRTTIFIHYMTDNFIIYSNPDGEVYIRENKGEYANFLNQSSIENINHNKQVNEFASKSELQKILEETIIRKEILYGKKQLEENRIYKRL